MRYLLFYVWYQVDSSWVRLRFSCLPPQPLRLAKRYQGKKKVWNWTYGNFSLAAFRITLSIERRMVSVNGRYSVTLIAGSVFIGFGRIDVGPQLNAPFAVLCVRGLAINHGLFSLGRTFHPWVHVVDYVTRGPGHWPVRLPPPYPNDIFLFDNVSNRCPCLLGNNSDEHCKWNMTNGFSWLMLLSCTEF